MKRKLRKLAAASLAAIQIMLVLTGCGNSQEQEKQQGLENPVNEEAKLKRLKLIKKFILTFTVRLSILLLRMKMR